MLEPVAMVVGMMAWLVSLVGQVDRRLVAGKMA